MKIKAIPIFIVLLCTVFVHLCPAQQKKSPAGINGIYKFTGKLNDKYPIFLWFVVKDSVLKGEVTYLKTAKRQPIAIAGQITKDLGMTIYEFTPKGYVTGTYSGEFKTGGLKGTWTTPGSDKELPYNLIPKDTVLTGVDMNLKPTSINGTYEYHFKRENAKETGGDGGIDIKQLNTKEFLVDINCITASPQNNLADLWTFKVQATNGGITFKIPETDCRFRIRVFKDVIVIDRLSGDGICGFGNNASIEGVFWKTRQVPSFR